MAGNASHEEHALVRDLVAGELVSRGIHTVVDLGVADQLVLGAQSVDELAGAVRAHGPSLYRLLRFLASYGLFVEKRPREFELTSAGALLVEGPHTMRSFARMFSSDWNQHPFGFLAEAVRTGKPAFVETMGSELFDYLEENPEAGKLFNRVMGDFLAPLHGAVSRAGDFSRCGNIVDVGGGRGSLLAEILRQSPEPSGIVMDVPAVAAEAQEWIADQGLSDRITAVAGDFFEAVPEDGDLYLLCRVIHDWDDKDAVRILSTIREAMRPDSRLYIVEQLMPSGNEPSFIKTTDLWMMLMFHEGRERTELEMREILEASGLLLSNIVKTEVSDVIIEALPA